MSTTANISDSIFDRYALQNEDSDKTANEVNQEDFLKLMTEQMKNQDPFEPADNGEFMSQMAQFSQVSSLDKLNESFSSFASNMLSSQTLQATGLLGRSVMVSGNQVPLTEGETFTASLDVPSAVSDITVSIRNSNGVLVDQVDLGPANAGLRDFTWNGTDLEGNPAGEGTYYITAEGVSASGISSTLDTLVPNTVSSVSIADSKVVLNTKDGAELSLSEVRHIQ